MDKRRRDTLQFVVKLLRDSALLIAGLRGVILEASREADARPMLLAAYLTMMSLPGALRHDEKK